MTQNNNLYSYKSPIPSSAQRVFQGVIFDVYHWEQQQFDGTYKTFEALKRRPAVQVIAMTKQGTFIVLKEEQPQDERVGYSLVGGGTESYDQTIKEGAKRELLEETGMRCEKMELLEITHPGGKIDWPCYYFIAYGCELVQEQQLDSGERIEVIEVNFEEFLEIVEHENFRNKYFSNYLFRIVHTPEKLKELKEKLGIN